MAIGRRTLLVTGACAAALPAMRSAAANLPVPPGGSLGFRLIRHGGEIGRHTVTFDHDGEALTVHTAVDALVTLVSIPIVRYRHRVVETWQGDRLTSLTGETDKNGEHEWVKALRGAAGLVVQGSKTERYVAPEPAGATTYWNRRVLDAPMISLEDGVLLRPKVAELATDTIPLASGDKIAAEHYNLSGPFTADLWYDRAAIWAGFAITAKDGSLVHYERL